MKQLVIFQRQITIASMDISISNFFEAFGNKHSCRMANLEVFVFVPDLVLSRRFAPGQKRKSVTKTKTSKFAMQQIYLLAWKSGRKIFSLPENYFFSRAKRG